MDSIESKFAQNPPLKTHKLDVATQVWLRIMAIVTAFFATYVMVTSKETIDFLGLKYEARYTYTPAFKFFVFTNAFGAASTLLSLLFVLFFARRGFITPTNYYLFFLHDLFMISLVLSSVAAATAIGYVGNYGNVHAGWMQICDQFGKYCHKVTASLILSYLSVLCLLVLTIINAGKSRHTKA